MVSPKLLKIINKYRDYIHKKQLKTGHGQTLRAVRSKNRILNFFLKNGRWPSRKGTTRTEQMLAARHENYLSKASPLYDSKYRRIVFASGLRVTNNKRPHNVKQNKKLILEFIKKHGRVPSSHGGETIEGEGCLRSKLDYYTKECQDMTLLGQVYKADPCHLSTIPMKFRAIINEHLNVEKPLIRLVPNGQGR